MKFVHTIGLWGAACLLLLACSTDKNTLINRTYHSTTARYNGYFNATELLNMSMKTYRNSRKEDFDSLLPVNPLPNDQEVLGLYPAIDTAIVKCTKVITNHAMPGAENYGKKKVEYNRWIDENWTTIGIANYYRRDYEGAMKNLEFVRKFFGKDPSNYIATLWIAKAEIETKQYTKAQFNLDALTRAAEEQDAIDQSKQKLFKKDQSESGKKKKKKKSKSKRKKEAEEEKRVEFPKAIRFDLEKTKADLALRKNDIPNGIKYLERSLQFTKKKVEKARVHFILGQLYAAQGSNTQAKEHFTLVLKNNAPFEMAFNARIKRAFAGGDSRIKKEFEKMLRDQKNAEFKDQIYYALADIALQEGNKEKGIEYLHKSTFYSISNAKQKGKSYERLGDISFADRSYIKAQKYYDSCAKVIPERYPNAEAIKNKAAKLLDLVKAVETAQYEDSVQRIAQMSPKEQQEFAEKLVKKIKEDEELRKRQEAQKLQELQSVQAALNQNQSGGKWYWNNAKNRADGFNEFRKQWGQRENEDNWRRSEKIVDANTAGNEIDPETNQPIVSAPKKDSLTPESLLAKLPVGDSAIKASNDRLVTALYDAGMIYKDQLNEPTYAEKQFRQILDRNYESEYNLLASYQLYKIHEQGDASKAAEQKNYILTYYPNSDYAKYLRDPNYFIKRKEIEALAEQEYINYLDRYNRGLYYPVIYKADEVIQNEKENPYRAKFMLLKALSLGQTSTDKQPLVPVLTQVTEEYPGTPEEAKAKEMLDIIKNGYSTNIVVDFSKKSIYKYEEKKEHWIIIFLDDKESASLAKSKVADFNKEFFSREKLNTSSKIYGDNKNVIAVKGFSEAEAERYMKVFKDTRKHLLDLNKSKIISISQQNMQILFETRKLADYELFYLENY